MRPQRLEAFGKAGRMRQHLAGRRRIAGAQGVAVAELQPIDAELVGQLVHQRLVRDGGLRHAEAAEGAGRRAVGEEAPRPRCARWARHRGPWHAPARGWRRSAPTRHRRRCRSRRARRRPAACPPRRSRTSPPPARDGAWSRPPCFRAACRPARPAGRASRRPRAISGWTERSSLPPKPPPQAVGMMRTASGSSRMTFAISSRSM